MTIRAFALILTAVLLAAIWLVVIYIINMFAGNPFLQVLKVLFWPVGIPAILLFIAGIQSQITYWIKRRHGLSVPSTVPMQVYPLVLGVLLGIVSIFWFAMLFESYSWYGVQSRMAKPLLLLVLSVLSVTIGVWIQRQKNERP